MYPVKEPHRISSPYGVARSLPRGIKDLSHNGIDIVSDSKDPHLFAVCDGVIVDDKDNYNEANRWIKGGTDTVGNRIVQKSIVKSQTFYISYYHMASNIVSVGDRVIRGQQIGIYGDVGISFGAHVHLICWPEYDYLYTGKTCDPSFLLEV